MGKSGFSIIQSFEGSKGAGVDWLDVDFSLPVSNPDLLTFLHLSFDLDVSSVVFIVKNGILYPLNNNESIIGDAFRSLPIIKGTTYNFQCNIPQTSLKFTASLEQ